MCPCLVPPSGLKERERRAARPSTSHWANEKVSEQFFTRVRLDLQAIELLFPLAPQDVNDQWLGDEGEGFANVLRALIFGAVFAPGSNWSVGNCSPVREIPVLGLGKYPMLYERLGNLLYDEASSELPKPLHMHNRANILDIEGGILGNGQKSQRLNTVSSHCMLWFN